MATGAVASAACDLAALKSGRPEGEPGCTQTQEIAPINPRSNVFVRVSSLLDSPDGFVHNSLCDG
jgi:hypothetical protein